MNWFGNPWLIAFCTAYYVWFAFAAWTALAVFLLFHRANRRQWGLFLAFLACILLEIAQLKGETNGSFSRRETLSLSRYFGVFGPLLWLWLAAAFAALWGLRRRWLRWTCRAGIMLFAVYVLFFENIPFFVEQRARGPAIDGWTAAELAAQEVLDDWQGPRRRKSMLYSRAEYLTGNLPAVFDNLSGLAWWTRGQSEGANLGNYPYFADYLFFCGQGGYRGDSSKYDPADYRPIVRVESTASEWMLYKRISK